MEEVKEISKAKALPPSPEKEHFIFKNAYYMANWPLDFLFENYDTMGPIYWVKSPIRKIAVLNDPECIRHVLQENNRNYVKSFGYDPLKLLLGNGLLTSEGDFWRQQRRMAQPSFHKEKLAAIVDTMITSTGLMLQRWEKLEGVELNISAEMNRIALDIVSKSLFISNVEDEIDKISTWVTVAIEEGAERIRNPFKLPMWIPTPSNLKQNKAVKVLDDVITGIIENRRNEGKQYDDLLSMLMDARDEDTGEGMSTRQLRDEVMTIFIAGHETTANALTWAFYVLAQNPEIEKKLQEEIDTVLQGKPVSFENLRSLAYTRMVIDETLRLYPPAWIIGRKNVEDDEIAGFHIPAGTNCLIPTLCLHRSPKYWKDPLKFDPERFSPEKVKEQKKFTYFPFGGGPRLCIGNNFALMEMQVVLASVMQRYRFELKDKTPIELDPLITLRPKQNVYLKLVKR
jgi:cytochrome P450